MNLSCIIIISGPVHNCFEEKLPPWVTISISLRACLVLPIRVFLNLLNRVDKALYVLNSSKPFGNQLRNLFDKVEYFDWPLNTHMNCRSAFLISCKAPILMSVDDKTRNTVLDRWSEYFNIFCISSCVPSVFSIYLIHCFFWFGKLL